MKRCIDIMIAGLATFLAMPLLVLVYLAIKWTLGSPVIFHQERAGLHGRPFRLHKFRTMRNATDTEGRMLPDGERLHPLGRWIRALSLDELPQLFNVLAGDMSLVGPRPLHMAYLPRYSREQARRHEVMPGITGWAQVNGRNSLSWEERLALDVWYVDHRTLRLDLQVLLLTVWKVVRMHGVSAENQATMSEFLGSPGDAGREP